MRLLFTALLTTVAISLFAQSNYQPGYIVKNNGDTLKGYIDYREWDRTPKTIQFKVIKADKNVSDWDPQSIRSFGINSLEIYISYTGPVSMDKTRLPDLQIGLDTTRAPQSIFLKQVTTGKYLTLYQQQDDLKTRFFISDKTGLISELKYYHYYLDMEDKLNPRHYDNKVNEATYFRGQLTYYADQYHAGDDKLTGFIGQAKFNDGDLKEIVDKINGSDTKTLNKGKTKAIRLFAGIGANYTQSQYYTVNYVAVPQPGQGDFMGIEPAGSTITSVTISPEINAGLDLFLNPNVQQTIIRTEFTAFYVSPKFKLSDGKTYTFNQYSASLTPQILFNIYNKDFFKFYVDGGISLNLSSYSNDKITDSNSNVMVTKPYKLEPYWASFPLQAGFVFNRRIELSFTYIASAGYSNYSWFSISNRTMGAGIKYLFGK
jgi:hypothetical protein